MSTPRKTPPPIRLTGVRQNNLKNLTVEFPRRQLTVVTGLSGSGKSSLAFDTLYAEGQRRYVESLSTYTRQFLEKMPKPELDTVENIPPAIALEQKNNIVNSRSTVGTQTEIIDYLRVLYARVGKTFCVSCGTEVKLVDAEQILTWGKENLAEKRVLILAALDLKGESVTKKKTSKKAVIATLQAQLEMLARSGIVRFLRKQDEEIEVFEATELLSNPKLMVGDFYPVIDRIKMPTEFSKDDVSRLLGSVEQALDLGAGEVIYYTTDGTWKRFKKDYACPACARSHRQPEPQLFSFNSPIGACPSCNGFGYNLELDERIVIPDPKKTLKGGAVDPFTKPSFSEWQTAMLRFAERNGIPGTKRYSELTPTERKLIWDGDGKDDKYPGIRGAFEELNSYKYKLHIRVFIRRYQSQNLCLTCNGARLHPDALAVKLGELRIDQVLDRPIGHSREWLASLKYTAREKKLIEEPHAQISRRLELLEEVGVGYLTLSRLAKSLSGGEFQRINLATQLGNGLVGTLYILDEPSIGLHASDTGRLIRVLKRLRDQGNTVVVVEHDLEMMRAADWIIELGPYAGRKGGDLVVQGSAETIRQTANSTTGQYLTGKKKIERVRPARGKGKRFIQLTGCRENNLKEFDVSFPLDRFVILTGVSGSGKSTLLHKTLYAALAKLFHGSIEEVGRFNQLYGADQIRGVVLLDQSPIGKNSRSNPATYLKAWDEIRRIYANQVLSLKRGFTPQHFSFNVDGGRCPVCKGEGEIALDMHFMAELKIPCDECEGKRFKKNVLDVTYKSKSVYELLTTTIDEAFEIFRDNPILHRKFAILREVGLGYLQVGQSATTLSGGESQRLKIAATLDERSAQNLLYLFDEPTTGLHLDDIQRLLTVIQDLVDAGHSVIMIEHHLDLIAQADHVVDLGPGGGELGGSLVAEGTPEDLARHPKSVTGQLLADGGYFDLTADRAPSVANDDLNN